MKSIKQINKLTPLLFTLLVIILTLFNVTYNNKIKLNKNKPPGLSMGFNLEQKTKFEEVNDAIFGQKCLFKDPFEGNPLNDHNLLGKGQYGVVCAYSKDNNKYAIKVQEISQYNKKQIEDEIAFHAATSKCPNVIKNYANHLGNNENAHFMKLELCQSDLKKKIGNGKLDVQEIKKALKGILLGLNNTKDCLHNKEIGHFDLKPDNIFICGDNYKIADLGFSVKKGVARTIGNHNSYYHNGISQGDLRADIYSTGVIGVSMAVGQDVVFDYTKESEYSKIENVKLREFLMKLTKGGKNKKLDDLPTVEQALNLVNGI